MNRNRIVTLVFLAHGHCALTLFRPAGRRPPPTGHPDRQRTGQTELQLSDSALHKMTVVTLNLTHPKNGPTNYTGVRLSDLLAKGCPEQRTSVIFTGSDGYTLPPISPISLPARTAWSPSTPHPSVMIWPCPACPARRGWAS